MDEDSNQNISVSDDVLNIENYFTNDQDVVNYFENAQNERKPLDKILENILKLGVIAVKSAQVGNQVDYVEKKFIMFHQLGMDLGINSATEIEHQKGTQKGVEFEKYCEEIISDIAKHHNDRLEATGNVSGIVDGSKKGDYVYTIQDSGKKIVLEMKDYTNPQSTPKLEKYLDESIENRGAEYGIVISKRKSGFSKDVGIFQEYGNKLFVALTTEETDNSELQSDLLVIALRWARLKLKQKSGTVDSALIIEKIENIQRIMKEFSNIKRKCTNIQDISNGISEDLEKLRETIKADLLEVSKSLK